MSNYTKLKTNLKLAIQRLKLLEKKKTEQSLKSRKEIADYIQLNKPDRARIRVEHIIREDNFVEAMEILEMFCDLLLARFGLIEKMKELDPGLDEAIATVLWASPRISNDIQEFKIIAEIFSHKYGKKYADACKTDTLNNVNHMVKKKLGVEPPPKVLVENYLIEIAKNFNIPYNPDRSVMIQSGQMDEDLINLRERFNQIASGGNNGGKPGDGNDGGFTGGACALEPQNPNIGFTDQNNAKRPDELIDLSESDDENDSNNNNMKNKNQNNNNNNNRGGNSSVLKDSTKPPLPSTLPLGDVTTIPTAPPPYYYYNSLNPNFVSQTGAPGYNPSGNTLYPSKEMHRNEADVGGEAPPLPNKDDLFFENHHPSVNNNDNEFDRFRPPTYEQSNEWNAKKNQHQQQQAPPPPNDFDLNLPSVPNDDSDHPIQKKTYAPPLPPSDDQTQSYDFDELSRRFENLKSKK